MKYISEGIPLKELALVAGITERRLQQLAKEGTIAAPIKRGIYPWKAVGDLFDHYREQALSKDKEQLQCEQLAKRNALLDIDIEEARGRLVETEKVAELLMQYCSVVKSSLYKRFSGEMPGELAGKDEHGVKAVIDSAVDSHLEDIRVHFSKVIPNAKTKRAQRLERADEPLDEEAPKRPRRSARTKV